MLPPLRESGKQRITPVTSPVSPSVSVPQIRPEFPPGARGCTAMLCAASDPDPRQLPILRLLPQAAGMPTDYNAQSGPRDCLCGPGSYCRLGNRASGAVTSHTRFYASCRAIEELASRSSNALALDGISQGIKCQIFPCKRILPRSRCYRISFAVVGLFAIPMAQFTASIKRFGMMPIKTVANPVIPSAVRIA